MSETMRFPFIIPVAFVAEKGWASFEQVEAADHHAGHADHIPSTAPSASRKANNTFCAALPSFQ
jgi:hypothetical protein